MACPRRKLQFERRPSTRYARRQSHLLKQRADHEAFTSTADLLAAANYEIDTSALGSHGRRPASCHELHVLPVDHHPARPTHMSRGLSQSVHHLHHSDSGGGDGCCPPPPSIIAPNGGSGLPLSSTYTRSIVDIISEFNARNETLPRRRMLTSPMTETTPPPAVTNSLSRLGLPLDLEADVEYLKWVSETKQNFPPPSKLTPTESCSSAKSEVSNSSSSRNSSDSDGDKTIGQERRASSPDSGCDMSIMVAYSTEPRVRRPPDSSGLPPPTLVVVGTSSRPTPAPRQSLRKSKSDSTPRLDSSGKATEQCEHPMPATTVLVQTKEKRNNDGGGNKYARSASTAVTTFRPLGPPAEEEVCSPHHPRLAYPLDCPYSRTAIYSLEGKRLQEQLEQESADSGQGSSILSQATTTAVGSGGRLMRSYASSRDILEMYGQGAGQPLAPRLLGFSSSDLRLPPAALLLSLSGKKANSAMSVHWSAAGTTGTATTNNNIYQNVPRRQDRDVVF